MWQRSWCAVRCVTSANRVYGDEAGSTCRYRAAADGYLLVASVDPGHLLEPRVFHGHVVRGDAADVRARRAGVSGSAASPGAPGAVHTPVVVVRGGEWTGWELGVPGGSRAL